MAKNIPERKGGKARGKAPTEKRGEFRGSPKMGVALISGVTFAQKAVVYYDVKGIAIVEGDIALGRVEAIAAATASARDAVAAEPTVARGVGITGSQFRWANCQIPYEIDPNLPNQSRVTDAIAHFEANTPFRFPLRTQANAAQYPNYVRFTDAGGCWSMVGMQGGQQTISLGADCGTGNAIHEIGHAVGLWHEQSREDRDLFVIIHWEHILAGYAAQFNQHITDGDDLGAYDYGSIMHYPRWAFSKDGQDTITPTDPNAQIGQRNGLSAGDIAAVHAMYPGCLWPKRPWTDPPHFKKILDDNVIKRPWLEPIKKIRDDIFVSKPPFDPGSIKMTYDPMPIGRPQIVTQPGTLQPFATATPHHAALVAAAGGTAAAQMSGSVLGNVRQQLLDLEAAIAQAHATATQANAEIARLQEVSDALVSAYGSVGPSPQSETNFAKEVHLYQPTPGC